MTYCAQLLTITAGGVNKESVYSFNPRITSPCRRKRASQRNRGGQSELSTNVGGSLHTWGPENV